MNAGEQLADVIERLARENPDWTETQVLEAMAEVTRRLRGQNPDWTQTQLIEAMPQGIEKFRRENPDWPIARPDQGGGGLPGGGAVLRAIGRAAEELPKLRRENPGWTDAQLVERYKTLHPPESPLEDVAGLVLEDARREADQQESDQVLSGLLLAVKELARQGAERQERLELLVTSLVGVMILALGALGMAAVSLFGLGNGLAIVGCLGIVLWGLGRKERARFRKIFGKAPPA